MLKFLDVKIVNLISKINNLVDVDFTFHKLKIDMPYTRIDDNGCIQPLHSSLNVKLIEKPLLF